MERVLVIPHYKSMDLLEQTVLSVVNQVDTVLVMNNGRVPIPLEHPKVQIIEPPAPLTVVQTVNFAVMESKRRQLPYTFIAHNDIVAAPDSADILFNKLEEVKETKWGRIYGCYDVFALFNPAFFLDNDVWFEPMLFPMYYADNHLYRIMDLLGYQTHVADCRIHHFSSSSIKRDPILNVINNLTFPHFGAIYNQIWQNETLTDVYATGLVKRPQS